MRKGTFLMLTFGILTTLVTVSVAQVGFESSRRPVVEEAKPSKNRLISFFSRGKKTETKNTATISAKPAASPVKHQVKNYHRELFGSPAPKTSYKNSSRRIARTRRSTTGKSRIRLASATKGKATLKPKATTSAFPRKPSVESKNKLVHAEFLQKPTAPKSNIIQQTAGEENPFNPFAPTTEKTDAPPKPRARLTIQRPPVRQPKNVVRNPVTSPDKPVRNPIQRTAVEEEFNPFNLPPVATTKPQTQPQIKPETQPSLPPLEDKKTMLPFDMDSNSKVKLSTVQVSIGWEKKSDINIGEECQLHLIVKNESDTTAKNVIVDGYFPVSVRLTKASPMPREKRDHVSWTIASMKPKEVKRIAISLIPSKSGDLAVKAFVRMTGRSESLFAVQEPMLKLNVTGASRIMLGESASQTIIVSNPGTGITNDIHVEAIVSKGLQHAKGKRISLKIGSLNPGESRKIHLALASVDGGLQQVDVMARSGANLSRSASTKVMVVAPSLALNISGPKLRYKGRNAIYQVTVTNTGKVANNNVRVMHKVPRSFQFLQANQNGKYNNQSHLVDWFIGQLGIGKSKTLSVKLKASELGTFAHQVSVISEEGAHANSQVQTKVDGTASLVLEIVDLDDPVEVGSETAYEVRVKNDGSKAATAVQITGVLPKDVQLIGAKGPTKSYSEKNQVIFKELTSLAPGKTALFRIHIKGKVEGNRRFRVRLNSGNMEEPLLFEEMTKFYGE